MSCVLKVIAQYIAMEVTKCPTFDDCNVKFQLGDAAAKWLQEAGVTDYVKSTTDTSYSQKNTGSAVGDEGRGKTDTGSRIITFIADGIDYLRNR